MNHVLIMVRMQPCFHMAGFLGSQTPVFDIAKYYQPGDRKDMLVRDTRLGGELAKHFGGDDKPSHSVALMRGHGFTVQGESIQEVVLRAVYTQQNASIQTTALLTRAAHFGTRGAVSGSGDGPDAGVQYLSLEESEGATVMTKWSVNRPWGLWLREVEAQGMYVNTA
jgi:hypothetical protein